MLKKPADIEKAINDLEFENQQYVKQIEIENQKLEALEKSAEDLRREIKLGNESVHQLEEDIKHYHRQFTHNRFSIESHRSTLEMLTKHEDALVSKKELMLKRANMEREERHGYLEHYRAILKDYQEKYASFKHNKELSEKKAVAEELEKKLQASLEMKLQLQEQCEKQKGKEDLPFTCINSYMLKVAELYMQMHREETDLEHLVKTCSSMVLSKSQERKEIDELQKRIEEQKRKNEEKKKIQELKEQEEMEKRRREEEQLKHMEEEKKREIAIKRKEEMAQISQKAKPCLKTPEQSPHSSQQQQQRQPFLLKTPQRPSVSTFQPAQLHIPQPKKSRLQDPAAFTTSTRSTNPYSRSSRSKIPLLQPPVMPSTSSQPKLLRQVQEKQMQKQIAIRHTTPKPQQSQLPPKPYEVCPLAAMVKPSSDPNVSSSIPQLTNPLTIAKSASSPVPRTQKTEQAPNPSLAVVSSADSPIMCPMPATPHRPPQNMKPVTPGNCISPGVHVESPGSEASTGSPFDLDKQLAKMRMLASKSPGAMDWTTRPMFEGIRDEDCAAKEICESSDRPTRTSSMFDSASTFLTTPFDLFGNVSAGGDASSSNNMFASPGKPDGEIKSSTNFNFDASEQQGDSSPLCLNFGGGEGSQMGGGPGKSTNNFMAMFGSGDEQEDSSDGDSFSFNFGSTINTSESASNRFSLF